MSGGNGNLLAAQIVDVLFIMGAAAVCYFLPSKLHFELILPSEKPERRQMREKEKRKKEKESLTVAVHTLCLHARRLGGR